MKMQTTYQVNKPNSAIGFSITVTTIYSSFKESEINNVAETLKNSIGNGVVSEVKADE